MTQASPAVKSILDQILSALNEAKSFSFTGHQNPDADVVGSQLGLAHFIERMNPDAKITIQNSGNPPAFLSFLPGFEKIKNVKKAEGQYDVAISFECSGEERMGSIIDLKKQAKKVINIDHHLHNPNFGDINFVDPTTSSTAEMIFKIINHSGNKVLKEEACCLYMGLVADTGWFRYSNTNPQTHWIASQLLEAGVPVADMSERMYMSRSEPSIRLLGKVLTNMSLVQEDKVAVIRLPQALMASVGATSEDLEEVVNYGLMLKSVQVSLLLKEKQDNVVKVSLRSKAKWDINKVARHFGGGGHKNASGCAFDGNLEQAEKAILKEVEKVF